MKPKPKSAYFVQIIALLGLGLLASCSDADWPHIFGDNEVPPGVLAAPRDVVTPVEDETDLTWMRLGDVPSRPKDFTAPALIDQTKDEMNRGGEEATRIKQQAESR